MIEDIYTASGRQSLGRHKFQEFFCHLVSERDVSLSLATRLFFKVAGQIPHHNH